MNGKNLCAVLMKKGEICLENRNIPEPSENEVLVEIHSVGICGSDVHFWKHGRVGDIFVKEPIILGHESSGTVLKVGKKVKNLKKGDKVCIEPGAPCGKCEFCKEGKYNHCSCSTSQVDGTLCQYYCHGADLCFKLPDNLSLEEGALIEPLSVAVHACRRAEVEAGKAVLICGVGAIGLLNLLTCKAMGVSKICVTDISDSRLAIAKKLGATSTVCVKDVDTIEAMKQITTHLQGAPDVTLECSGAESSINLGMRVTKSGGVLMLVGLGAPETKVPLIEACCREVDIRGVFRYVNCYPIALELVSRRAVDLKPLITHHFNLQNVFDAFELAHTGKDDAIKVIVHCAK